MHTRSKSYPFNSNATIPRRSNRRRVPNIVEPEIRTIEEIVPMANRTMEELLQAPTEGYGEAIVILKILEENFHIKTNLLLLVPTNKFYGFERDNPHTHISNFKRMTATLKYEDVPNDAIKLMLFPYSLEGAARIWYEKEPPNSILTRDDLVNKFVNQFFPPSKTTHLKNEFSRFTQRFEETFGEAWERFKEMLRACPHHGFSELTQIDTFYNGLNEQDQDSLNAAAGGNLLSKTTREALKIIKNKSKISNLVEIVNKQVITHASAKAVEKTCVTCGGVHAYYDCIATNSNQPSVCAATRSYNQVSPPNRASHQIPPPGFSPVQNNPNRFNQNQGQWNNFRGNNFQNNQGYREQMNNAPNFKNQCFQNQPFSVPNNQIQPGIPNDLSSYIKSNEIMIKSMQNQINVLRGDFNKQEENLRRKLNNDIRSILGSFFQNQASTSGTLPSNIVPNPKDEMKAVTTRSGLAYEGPLRPLILLLRSFTDALLLMPKFASTNKSLLTNKDKLFELAKVPLNENCSAMLLKKLLEKLRDSGKFLIPCDFPGIDVCHALANLGASINLMPLSIWKKLSLPELTPTRMTLELADRSITRPKGVAEDVFVKVGKFHFPTDFVVVDFEADPRVPLILGRSFLRIGRALIDVYREEITLRVNDESITFNLNQTMRYSSTYDDNSVKRVDVIDITCEEFVQNVLDFQYNPKSSNPTLVSNSSISESDSCKVPIVKSSSPILTPFRESDFFLEEIEDFLNDESIPTGIDNSLYDLEGDILYLEKLLNEDPFQLHPMDLKQAEETKAKSSVEEPLKVELKELPSHLEYVFLEESNKLPVIIAKYLKDVKKEALIKVLKSHKRVIVWKISDIKGYFQIPINPQDQEKTTFTCPYGTFAYRRMPFGLCNAPGTFQRCMIAIFHDMIEKTMEVFMDDFSVFRDSFSSCLTNLDKMLKRCEETNLVLNWEKCHFMYREWIVLGHKISKSGIEVDREKVDVIAKLPHPTTIKGVRSFLGHAGFYRRFIQDFSKIARPMTHLLEKETPFVFSKECVDSFNTLKKKPIEAPIMVGIDFMGLFPSSKGNKYILVAVDYLSKWVEAKAVPTNDARVVVKFLKSRDPFLNDQFIRVIIKYGVTHRLATAYHHQTSGQVELVYGKSCHLPIELEHMAYLALNHVNFDLKTAGDHRKLQMNELSELRDKAYENYVIYKERTKKLHDSKIKNRIFNVGPFTITQVFSYGTVELSQPNGPNFKVNGHRVKHYFGGDIPSKVVPDLHMFPMDK
nr:reverse transcriptase domain-containing protein [Tanacetum cinerariifolium]